MFRNHKIPKLISREILRRWNVQQKIEVDWSAANLLFGCIFMSKKCQVRYFWSRSIGVYVFLSLSSIVRPDEISGFFAVLRLWAGLARSYEGGKQENERLFLKAGGSQRHHQCTIKKVASELVTERRPWKSHQWKWPSSTTLHPKRGGSLPNPICFSVDLF